jgi:hypothetical protein
MATITRDHAELIAKKLEGERVEGASHHLVKVYHNNKKVAQFGIQRTSKKDTPHPYVPAQLFVSKKECLGLAVCTMSRDEWVAKLISKGQIEQA